MQPAPCQAHASHSRGCRARATPAHPPRHRTRSWRAATADTGDSDPAAAAALPASFWDERRALLDGMWHDRADRRARLRQLREHEEAALRQLPPQARLAYEVEQTALRIAAAQEQKARLAHALSHGLKVIIDCCFVQQQPQQQHAGSSSSRKQQQQQGPTISHEVRSLAKQLELAVAYNKRSAQPVALTVTSWSGQLEAFANHMGAAAWPVNKHAGSLLELGLVPPQQLVLLSPDAPDPLLTLDESRALVIGGIVDRSVRKGLTAGVAQQHGGLTMARLPIKEHAQALGLGFAGASTRPALSVSDVVLTLLEYRRSGDWAAALTAGMPARRRQRHGNDLERGNEAGHGGVACN